MHSFHAHIAHQLYKNNQTSSASSTSSKISSVSTEEKKKDDSNDLVEGSKEFWEKVEKEWELLSKKQAGYYIYMLQKEVWDGLSSIYGAKALSGKGVYALEDTTALMQTRKIPVDEAKKFKMDEDYALELTTTLIKAGKITVETVMNLKKKCDGFFVRIAESLSHWQNVILDGYLTWQEVALREVSLDRYREGPGDKSVSPVLLPSQCFEEDCGANDFLSCQPRFVLERVNSFTYF